MHLQLDRADVTRVCETLRRLTSESKPVAGKPVARKPVSPP